MFFSPCLLSVKSQDSMASKSVLTMVVLRHVVSCMSCMPLMLMPPDVMSCHPNTSWQVMSLCQTVPCHAMSSCRTMPCHHVKPYHVIMRYGHAMPTHQCQHNFMQCHFRIQLGKRVSTYTSRMTNSAWSEAFG